MAEATQQVDPELMRLAEALITNKERRGIQRRAMAGREPTAEEQARLAADMPRLEQNSENLASITNLPQSIRAAGDAYNDPSLANLTYAGTQAAMTAFRPMLAAKLMAGGFGLAGARDLMSGGSAEAQARGKDANAEAKAANAKAGLAKAEAALAKEKAATELAILKATNEKEAADAQRRKEEADAALLREQQKVKDAEDAAARGRANAAYTEGLKTERRFSDTETGKIFDKFGPMAPGAVAAGTGMITGAGLRGMGVASKAALYGVPAALGTLTGTASAHWPLAYESSYAPTVNPSFQAAQNYIREAPPEDARAKQLAELLLNGTIKKENPVRAEAEKNLYDPTKFTERSILGAVEGVAGGLAGSEALPAAKYLIKNAPKAIYESAKAPGAAVAGLIDGYGATKRLRAEATSRGVAGGQTDAVSRTVSDPQTVYSRYSQVPQSARDNIAEALLNGRAIAKGDVPAAKASTGIRETFAQAPYNTTLPDLTNRVKATQQIANEFKQQTGRDPTRQELMLLLDPKNLGTLGVPATAALAAALMNNSSDN